MCIVVITRKAKTMITSIVITLLLSWASNPYNQPVSGSQAVISVDCTEEISIVSMFATFVEMAVVLDAPESLRFILIPRAEGEVRDGFVRHLAAPT